MSINIVNLSDADISRLAYAKASADTDDKCHKRLNAALFAAVPAAAGVRVALKQEPVFPLLGQEVKVALEKVNTHVKNDFFNGKIKQLPVLLLNEAKLTGRAAKLANGLKVGLGLTAIFGVVDLVLNFNSKLNKNSPTVRDFEQKHPVLSTFGLAAAAMGAVALGGKGINRLVQAIPAETAAKFNKAVLTAGDDINKSQTLNTITGKISKAAEKIHPAIKNFGQSVLEWAPLTLLAGGVIHSISHNDAKNEEYVKNFRALKECQAAAAMQDA